MPTSTPPRLVGRRSRLRAARWLLAAVRRRRRDALDMADILDLFEEQVYAGEITPDGHYVNHCSGPMLERMIGGRGPADVEAGALWESRIHPDDWAEYERFNRDLLSGRDAEVTYRLRGL